MRAGRAYRPTRAPSTRNVQITEGLGKRSVCGQVLDGLSNVASSVSPGCWTALKTVLPSGVISGPQVSAPTGTVRNCCTWPRCGPSTGQEYMPSLEPRELPSVEIHRLPAGSKATLSGQEIGLTWSFG